jgi:ATP-dependent DNA helicase RecQ
MKGGGGYRLVWPAGKKASASGQAAEDDGEFDPILYSALKDLRNALAERDGVPAYLVFSNNTLESLTRRRPRTIEEGLAVKGVGPAKAERYLAPFLERIGERAAV